MTLFFRPSVRLALLVLMVVCLLMPAAPEARAANGKYAPVLRTVETYYNSIRSLQANFTQTGADGTAHGVIYLAKPGRLRVEYRDRPQLVVADGRWIIYHDKQMNQVSYIGHDETPVGLLLRNRLNFNQADVKVTNVDQSRTNTFVTLIDSDDPAAGKVILNFSNNPVRLVAWTVVDGQGKQTKVTFSNVQLNQGLNPSLFKFRHPGRPGQGR